MSMGENDWENPYYDEVAGGVTTGGGQTSRAWSSEQHIEVMQRREELVEKYAWAIPNYEAIQTLVNHEPILEVGAGTGYWAWLVRQVSDVEILATDIDPPVDAGCWYPVWSADARDVVTDYPVHTLFICWPTYADEWATATLGRYEGESVIYVGEGRGGCTATDRFHEMLHEDYFLDRTVDIPQYLGIHDRCEVWRSQQ